MTLDARRHHRARMRRDLLSAYAASGAKAVAGRCDVAARAIARNGVSRSRSHPGTLSFSLHHAGWRRVNSFAFAASPLAIDPNNTPSPAIGRSAITRRTRSRLLRRRTLQRALASEGAAGGSPCDRRSPIAGTGVLFGSIASGEACEANE